ncbi:MAG: M42 family peptidase [Anaerolineae bacterium]|nr:M42 family peptidase [Anaerolineae bacterium]
MTQCITPEMIGLLERLCNADGAPGNEREVRQIIANEIRDVVDSIEVDQMGNLIASVTNGQPRKKVMLAAHMDEVGFMVVKTGDDEFFEFRSLGGIDPKILPAKTIRIGKDKFTGVISPRTAHLTTTEERKSVVPLDKLQITVGSSHKKKVVPGDYACFDTPFVASEGVITAKALDDRVGCANVIWLLKHPPADTELFGVFTVQEELGLRGAGVSAFRVNPDLALVFDTTPAVEPPLLDDDDLNVQYNVQTGKGPAIYTLDASQVHFEPFIQLFVSVAESLGLHYQLRQPGAGGTDSGAIHLQRAGIYSQSISVPVRYLHTPRGMMRISDWEETLKLIEAVLNKLPEFDPREK